MRTWSRMKSADIYEIEMRTQNYRICTSLANICHAKMIQRRWILVLRRHAPESKGPFTLCTMPYVSVQTYGGIRTAIRSNRTCVKL